MAERGDGVDRSGIEYRTALAYGTMAVLCTWEGNGMESVSMRGWWGSLVKGVVLIGSVTTVSAQVPVADYRFNYSLDDSLGLAPALTKLVPGDGAYVPVTFDGVPTVGHAFSEGAGLQLDVDGVLSGQHYTMAIVMAFQQTDGYAKIVDTKALKSDDGLYAVDESLYLYPSGALPPQSFQPDTYYQIVLTRAADGTTTGYIDGIQQFTYDDSLDEYAAFSPERLLTFFRDDETTENLENSAGTVLRIRLFDAALDAGQVADLEVDRVGDVLFANGFEPTP